MKEANRIKERLRAARDMDELRAVWLSEADAIHGLSEPGKTQVINLKEWLKNMFVEGPL